MQINEKSRAGINGYIYIKNPLSWEWHFYKLLCEEMMTSYLSPSFFPLCSRNIISSHKSLQKCPIFVGQPLFGTLLKITQTTISFKKFKHFEIMCIILYILLERIVKQTVNQLSRVLYLLVKLLSTSLQKGDIDFYQIFI